MTRCALMAVSSMVHVGGAQYVNRLLDEALRGLGYNVRHRTLLDGAGFGPHALSRLHRASRFVLGAQLDRRWRPSLVVADHARIAYKARLFRAQSATKVVFAHGIEAWGQFDRRVQDTFNRADFILCNSQFTRHKIISMYRLDPTRCVHVALGADPKHQDGAPLAARSNTFILLGRAVVGERYKGHDQVLQAWPSVLRRVPQAILRIVGDGDDLPRLKRLAADLSLGDHVHFDGLVDEAHKHALLRSARGLLMLSTGEGFGLASVEAMALGTPVVGLEGTVTAELVRHESQGLLLPNRSPESIGAAVLALSTDANRWQRMSSGAQERWRSDFSKPACLQRLRTAFSTRLPELRMQGEP